MNMVTIPPAPTGYDDTNMLNEFLASQPNWSQLAFSPTDPYLCENTIKLRDQAVIDITGLYLVRDAKHGRKWNGRVDNVSVMHLLLANCLGVTLSNIIVEGPKNPDAGYIRGREGQHGIGLTGCSDVVVENSHISHVQGDFIWISAMGKTWCQRITVWNNIGMDAGRHGICIEALASGKITDNTMTDFHQDGIHYEKTRVTDGWNKNLIEQHDNTMTHA